VTNARHRSLIFSASVLLLVTMAGGCSRSEHSSGPLRHGTQPVVPAVALYIDASSTMTAPNQPVSLKAVAMTSNAAVNSYRWTFSDGQQATGSEVSATFPQPGDVEVTLEGMADDGSITTTTAMLFVVDGNSLATHPLRLATAHGDVDGIDGTSLLDALVVAQALSGRAELTADQLASADLDLNGVLTRKDLNLELLAVLNGTLLPAAILNDSVYPGSVTTIVSSTLLDPAQRAEVRVNGTATPAPMRTAVGYANFLVPTDLPSNVHTIAVELLINGSMREIFEVPIQHLGALPVDAAQDVMAFLAEAKGVLTSQQSVLTAQMATSDLTSDEQAGVLASARAGAAMLDNAMLEMQPLLAANPGFAQLFQKVLYANGLQEFRTELNQQIAPEVSAHSMTIAALTGDDVCDVMIPAVCGLKRAADLASAASDAIGAGCSAAAVTVFLGTVIPVDGPVIELTALATFLRVCVPMAVALEVGSTAALLFSPVDVSLSADATPLTTGSDATWRVTTSVTFVGLREVCSTLSSTGLGAAAEQALRRRIVSRLIARNVSIRLLAEGLRRVSRSAYDALLDAINSSVGNTMDATGLSDAFGDLVAQVCPNLTAGTALVPARRVLQQPPADAGTLQFEADDSATYHCPPLGPAFRSNIMLQGQLQLCNGPGSVSAAVACSSAAVVITMGDNGNLLDDIFEVIVDGQTVLTSGAPVRSASTTLHLPPGRITVLMRGLAAPDGVGTYFINISGAALVSGTTSGSDLVPGVVKQFVIEVL
jgi:hypothetical protein